MDWRKDAVKLRDEGWTHREIAKKHGKSLQTVKNFFTKYNRKIAQVEGSEEQKPSYTDHGDYYVVTSGRKRINFAKDELRLLKQLYCEQKLTINQVCRELDLPRRDFWLIKTAFSITKDDIPFLDEDLDGDIDSLVEESIERKKRQYFIRLQQKEIEYALRELEQYRRKDYFIDKIHQLVSEHSWQYDGPKVPLRPKTNSGLMLEVPIVDLHLAKLAWEPETGENYDSKIAEKRFMEVIYDVVERSRNREFEQIIFPIGNDFFNFDDIAGNTTRGTAQDNDSRWQKMFLKGNELLIRAIDILAQLAPVKVFQIPGNHDTQTSFYAIVNLASYFRNDENVTVDTDPKTRKYVEFGKNLIGFTHGDKENKRIFGNMQVEAPEAWGRTLYREWHTGHLHSEQVKEEFGVKVRRLSSVTATDSWHASLGYVGAIAVSQSFVWDKQKGLREIWYTTVT